MAQDELKHKIQQFFKTYEYSNLITIDEAGRPKGRMMENTPLGDDLVVWFATGIDSSKVAEIRKNGSASVFVYRPADHSSLNFLGQAEVVTSDHVKAEKWREKWTAFWEKGPADPKYALIKVVPKKIIYLDFPAHKQEVLEF